jgi:hypothetical protein
VGLYCAVNCPILIAAAAPFGRASDHQMWGMNGPQLGSPLLYPEKHDSLDRQIPVAGLARGPVCPDRSGLVRRPALVGHGDARGSLHAQADRRGAVRARMPPSRSRDSIGTSAHASNSSIEQLLRRTRMLPVDGAMLLGESRTPPDVYRSRLRGNPHIAPIHLVRQPRRCQCPLGSRPSRALTQTSCNASYPQRDFQFVIRNHARSGFSNSPLGCC